MLNTKSHIIGQRFGGLVVVGTFTKKGSTGHIKSFVRVRCDCGREVEKVRRKIGVMCRYCADEKTADQVEKGASSVHPLGRCWNNMLRRCYDVNLKSYKDYGAKGVTVCDRWRGERKQGQKIGSSDGFQNFLADMGPKPTPDHSIDRIDPFGNYEPSNCRWATRSEQQKNKRVNTTKNPKNHTTS